MKEKIKKIDWVQIGVVALGAAATIARSIYETKRFNSEFDKKYNDNYDKKINELIDEKLKNRLK